MYLLAFEIMFPCPRLMYNKVFWYISTIMTVHFLSPDNDEDHGKDTQDTMKPVLSLGKEGSAFLAPKLDYSPSFVSSIWSREVLFS